MLLSSLIYIEMMVTLNFQASSFMPFSDPDNEIRLTSWTLTSGSVKWHRADIDLSQLQAAKKEFTDFDFGYEQLDGTCAYPGPWYSDVCGEWRTGCMATEENNDEQQVVAFTGFLGVNDGPTVLSFYFFDVV